MQYQDTATASTGRFFSAATTTTITATHYIGLNCAWTSTDFYAPSPEDVLADEMERWTVKVEARFKE